jgi:hypothetical protein
MSNIYLILTTQIATINHSSLELKSLSFTANFVREVYQITLNSEGSGSFEIFKNNMPHFPEDASQALSIDSATRIGINALPTSGWKFAQWFGLPNPNDLRDPSPSLNQYSANINFIPVEDSNVTAQFVRQKFAFIFLLQKLAEAQPLEEFSLSNPSLKSMLPRKTTSFLKSGLGIQTNCFIPQLCLTTKSSFPTLI